VIPQIDLGTPPNIFGVRQLYNPNVTFPVAFTATNIRIGNDGVGVGSDGCEAFPAGFFTGRYALVDRGTCAFTIKVKNAQLAGAIGAVIAQNVPDAPFSGAGTDTTITIPSMMISQADGNRIRAAIAATGPLFINGFEDGASGGPDALDVQIGGPNLLTNFIARTVDGGVNWTQLSAAEGLPEDQITRGEIGWGPGGVAYVAFANAAANPATRGLWRSADGGATWAQTASTAAFIERQGDYDLVVLVDPANANKVYMGAVDQWVTTDGGATITKNSFWNPAGGQMPDYIHADHHGYFAKPGDANTVYTVSDGGVHRTTDGGANYTEQNFGYNVAMPNNVTVSADGTRAVVGTQDNGSLLYFGSSDVWVRWAGGDGGVTAFDQQNPLFFYSAQPYARFFGTNTGGNNSVVLPLTGSGSNTNGGLFYAPVALDPLNGNRMLIGTGQLWYSTNVRNLGTATFTAITLPAGFGSINSISFSPLSSNTAFVGSSGGALVRVDLSVAPPVATSIQGNLPLGNDISQVLVDPTDATGNTLFVVRADYGSQRIHRTTNGGTTWTPISGNLPDIPLFSVARDELNPGNLFVGSELGLWYGAQSGGNYTWTRFDYGIPHTRVFGLTRFDADTMFVAVYGRGTFKATRSPLRVSVAELRNDTGCDSDGNLDPGDSASIPVTVRNVSASAVGPITVNVASTGTGIVLPQLIASLAPGASTTVPFTVTGTPTATCGNTAVTATALVNGTTATGTRDISVDQNSPAVVGFVEDAEGTTSRFALSKTIGPDTWQRVNSSANTGTFSFFAADINGFSEKSLTSPWLNVVAPPVLSFALRYDTEGDATQRWDGVVLESRTRANIDAAPGPWVDAGANSTVPYDGLLFNNTAIGPARRAWSGNQLTWRSATAPLSASAGQQVQFRFRFVSDQDTATTGFWLDDVNLIGVGARAQPTCDAVCN
ncbi:MAG TPA: PA domain-containing protein, partial [Xanthomonadales bacterium]|nr:PA domain-containing protein [Xanthomonadales bacterium]